MIVSKDRRQRVGQNVYMNDYNFERVDVFKYLGVNITSDNTVRAEINARIQAASRSLYSLSKLFTSKDLSRATKIQLYTTLIRPVATYACETWTMTKSDERALLIFERKVLRKIFGPVVDDETGEIRRRHNNELEDVYGPENIVRWVKSQRLRWAGHVVRAPDNRLIHRAFFERPVGSRSIGRPRTRWRTNVERDLEVLDVENWILEAQFRDTWREIVVAARTHPGL